MNSYLSTSSYSGCRLIKIITFNHLWTESFDCLKLLFIFFVVEEICGSDHVKFLKIFKTKIININ